MREICYVLKQNIRWKLILMDDSVFIFSLKCYCTFYKIKFSCFYRYVVLFIQNFLTSRWTDREQFIWQAPFLRWDLHEFSRERNCVVYHSVADPDPGSGAFLSPGSGMDKKQDPDPGWKIPDHILRELRNSFWTKILQIRDPVPFCPLDPGWIKKKIRIRDEKSRIIF